MDPTWNAVLSVSMRWIHLASVVTLLGGFIFARFALAPALAPVAAAERQAIANRAVAAFRPLLYTVLIAVLGSGLYNYLTKTSYPPHYHMFMGIKFLFVLHIFAVSVLYSLPGADEAKRTRWLTGMVYSGLAIIAIAGYLRWMSLK